MGRSRASKRSPQDDFPLLKEMGLKVIAIKGDGMFTRPPPIAVFRSTTFPEH